MIEANLSQNAVHVRGLLSFCMYMSTHRPRRSKRVCVLQSFKEYHTKEMVRDYPRDNLRDYPRDNLRDPIVLF